MDYRDLLNRKITPVLSPYTIEDSANEFLAKFGGFLEKIALVAKPPSGLSFYRSKLVSEHSEYRTWFSSYAKLCVDVGFQTYGVMSALADLQYGRDPKYRTFDNMNNNAPDYVCPSRKSFWQYLAAVGKELASFDLTGIILSDTRFVRDEFCLCSHCRNEFAEISGLKNDFQWDEIQSNPSMKNRWIEWKRDTLVNNLQFFCDEVWSAKRNIDIAIKADLDPEIGLENGAMMHFGQDLQAFGEMTGHALVHPYLFTPIIPTPSTSDLEFNNLLESMNYFKDLQNKQFKTSIYWWGNAGEQELQFVEALRTATNAGDIFLYSSYPKEYRRWRESILGIF
ncbi:MAG: hypothetical protein ACTSUV_01190 [Candidatus Ranarchaeia archaeon]